MYISDSDIKICVIQCISECLALNAEEVKIDSRLIDDLGADSLDFVDILFSIEQHFRIKLRSEDVGGLLRADFSEADLVNGIYLNGISYQGLLQWLPKLKDAPDPARITPAEVFSYITVQTFMLIVKSAVKLSPHELKND